MNDRPLFSLIMMVRNGYPYLPEALDSVAAQTCRSFELIVQDGASSDGTLDLVNDLKHSPDRIPHLSVESGRDHGIADAYNKAVKRCRGRYIGSIDSDNLLEPECLEVIAARFRENRDAAVIYSGQTLIHPDGSLSHTWIPSPFNVLDLLDGRLVPPFGSSFFDSRFAPGRLYADASLKTCADFDIWLRYLDLKIVRVEDLLTRTRLSQNSMTCRPENYEQFCADKITALRRYFQSRPEDTLSRALLARSVAGIYLWAADSLYSLEGDFARKRSLEFLHRAQEADPQHPKIPEFATREAQRAKKPSPDAD